MSERTRMTRKDKQEMIADFNNHPEDMLKVEDFEFNGPRWEHATATYTDGSIKFIMNIGGGSKGYKRDLHKLFHEWKAHKLGMPTTWDFTSSNVIDKLICEKLKKEEDNERAISVSV